MSVETRSVNTSQEGSVSHSQTFTEARPAVITSVLTVNVYAELLVMDVQRSTAVCVCVLDDINQTSVCTDALISSLHCQQQYQQQQ